jgi:hypothetical protein
MISWKGGDPMKLSRILAAAVLAACLTTSAVSAAPSASVSPETKAGQQMDIVEKKEFKTKSFGHKHDWDGQQDPVKFLQEKKEKIQTRLKEGKITEEKAKAITAGIDTRIKEIQEFDKLSLQDKKNKLKSNFKAKIESKVKEGKLTQDKAKELEKEFAERVDTWDGTSFPHFFKGKCKGKIPSVTN